MRVLFNFRDPGAVPLRHWAERRLRIALQRLEPRVSRAELQLSDINGPRGGIDKQCQLELKTDGFGIVIVTSVAGDWRTALDDALVRATRLLLRQRRHERDPRRAHSLRLRELTFEPANGS
jgi:hypothetical protein